MSEFGFEKGVRKLPEIYGKCYFGKLTLNGVISTRNSLFGLKIR